MTTQNPINLDTPDDHPLQEWVESEWIGTGKKYPISGEVHHNTHTQLRWLNAQP